MLLNLGNITPPWKLYLAFKMLTQSLKLAWSSTNDWLMVPSTSSTHVSFIGLVWFKIWRPICVVIFCQSIVSSKVVMGFMNTSEACKVLEIKVISWLKPICCGVRNKLVDKNSKDSTLLSNTMNEGSIGSTYSLVGLSLPLISSLTTVATWTCMVKVWRCMGMIFEHVPPLSGLTSLVMTTSCNTNGVGRALLLVPIFTDTKLRGLYLKIRKSVQYVCAQLQLVTLFIKVG
jgi:hypothetical protein